MTLNISKKTARNFLLLKQRLLPPKSFVGKKGIAEVFNKLRLIQYDPLNICGRNVDLVLQSRIKKIHPNAYYDWLYNEKQGIECYDKELCIIPISDLPLCLQMTPNVNRQNRFKKFLSEQKKDIEALLIKIDKNGPICSSDIKNSQKVHVFWQDDRWGRAALDTLWRLGRLVIAKRENGRKYYDLPKKVYGEKFIKADSKTKISPQHILRRIRAVGMLPKSGTGQAWLGIGTGRDISPIASNMIKNGDLLEIKVEGVNRTFIIDATDKKLIYETEKQDAFPKQVAFLAPLDNLLWDRQMIKEIFDFDYRWEVYFPPSQRKFGYYVLPILYGDHLIGRIEPVLKDKTLEIKGLWFRPNFLKDNSFEKEFPRSLNEFQQFLNAQSIKRKSSLSG